MDRSLPLVQTLCQGIFVIAITVLSLTWLVNKLKIYITRSTTGTDNVLDNDDQQEHYRHQQKDCRQKMQGEHNSKALYYKENILKPQQEAKRLKKEKEVSQFSTPSWLTKGECVGGEGVSDSDDADDVPEGRRAARRRKSLQNINQKVAADAAAAVAAKQKQKKVIKLPEEPDICDEGVIFVMLRTPIGTICQRRFLASDKIQCLYDFITTHGFSQRLYVISTSFPRRHLENLDSSFSEFSFGKRVVLNIEERD